jgi:hypothetical protein
MKKITIDNYLDNHYINRSNWLKAAVLGANDGIISISSLAMDFSDRCVVFSPHAGTAWLPLNRLKSFFLTQRETIRKWTFPVEAGV